MQLLLDENVPRPILKALRGVGITSKTVQEIAGVGVENGKLVELAKRQNLIIVTFDKDFEALAEKETGCKVMLLDLSSRRAARRATTVAKLIKRALEKLEKRNFVRITAAL